MRRGKAMPHDSTGGEADVVSSVKTGGLTVRQKILLAAWSWFCRENKTEFSFEDLVVRCWELYPEAFSLRGYAAKHPDSSRVQAKLAGGDGLCGLDWLELADRRMYRVTRKGRAIAKQLKALAAEPVVAVPKPARVRKCKSKKPVKHAQSVVVLSVEDVRAINAIAKSEALRKFLRGSPLTFADASVFWAISRVIPEVVQQRLDAAGELLERVVYSLGKEGPTDSRLPSLATCYGLLNLHRLMLRHFSRELDAARAQQKR